MNYIDHYYMERRILERALGVIFSRAVNGEEILIGDKPPLDLDTTLVKLAKSYIELFRWVYKSGSLELKKKLEMSLEGNFPNYKAYSYSCINIDHFINYFVDSDIKRNFSICGEYHTFLLKYNMDPSKMNFKEFLNFHNRIMKVYSLLEILRKRLEAVSVTTFYTDFMDNLTDINNITSEGIKDFSLVVNALPTLTGRDLHREALIHCSLFTNKKAVLYQDRNVGLVYYPENFISMEADDSQCNLFTYLEKKDMNEYDEVVRALLMIEHISMDKYYQYLAVGLYLCRILPQEYILEKMKEKEEVSRRNIINELVISSMEKPVAILAYKSANRDMVNAFATIHNLPILYYDGEKLSIKKKLIRSRKKLIGFSMKT